MMNRNKHKTGGYTLLDIALVIGLLLGLMFALLFGISAYQRMTDRARCIMNVVNIQKSMRAFMNSYEYRPGEAFTPLANSQMGANLQDNIFGTNNFIQTPPTCPSFPPGTSYIGLDNNTFPEPGVMWATCPGSSTNAHVPKDTSNL